MWAWRCSHVCICSLSISQGPSLLSCSAQAGLLIQLDPQLLFMILSLLSKSFLFILFSHSSGPVKWRLIKALYADTC